MDGVIVAIKNSLFVAWRYLAFHRSRTITLVTALAIILFIPLFLELIVRDSREQLTARADSTPMVFGAPGSSLDLVMNSLYFTRARPRALPMSDVTAIDDTGLALAIPLNTRFWAGAHPIIGTTLDYLEMRGLEDRRGTATRGPRRSAGRSPRRRGTRGRARRQRHLLAGRSLQPCGTVSAQAQHRRRFGADRFARRQIDLRRCQDKLDHRGSWATVTKISRSRKIPR